MAFVLQSHTFSNRNVHVFRHFLHLGIHLELTFSDFATLHFPPNLATSTSPTVMRLTRTLCLTAPQRSTTNRSFSFPFFRFYFLSFQNLVVSSSSLATLNNRVPQSCFRFFIFVSMFLFICQELLPTQVPEAMQKQHRKTECRDREQDIPDWLKPFTEGLVGRGSGSSRSAGETIPKTTLLSHLPVRPSNRLRGNTFYGPFSEGPQE